MTTPQKTVAQHAISFIAKKLGLHPIGFACSSMATQWSKRRRIDAQYEQIQHTSNQKQSV